jgi:6-pyruvoyltetrahydropterin/6-carboxytetrahydropterin synthase
MTSFKVSRYHDISCGHRVVGHEHKCRFLHGHNYRIHFHCRNKLNKSLDDVGRVVDFSIINSKLCEWLESHWDHRMLIWNEDPMLLSLQQLDKTSIAVVPFNPTAENLAKHLVEVVAPEQFNNSDIEIYQVDIEETRKCSASYSL